MDVGSMVATLKLNIKDFTTKMQQAENSIKDTESRLSGFKDIGGRFTSLGKSLSLGVTAPVVALGAAVTKVGSDFSSAMSEVSAISGATGKELESLTSKAKEMGAKTKFSATESAEAFKYMAMAGWKTNEMLNGIEGIMNLAAASGEDLAQVSDIVTDALTAFGLQAKDSAHFSDVLAMASNATNTSVGMLGESFKYVAPVAGAMKYSIEDVSVALGLMANSGIKASMAGTAMRSGLTRLVKPTEDSAFAMRKYNISIANADGTMKPLSETMQMLRARLGNLSDAEKSHAIALLFGQEAMSGWLAIVNASEQDFNKVTEAINKADGTAQSMADTMNDNLSGQWTLLKSQLEGVGIQLAEILIPVLRDFLTVISKVVDWFSQLSPATQKTIMVVAGLAAAVGPLLVGLGSLLTSIYNINKYGKLFIAFMKTSTVVTKGMALASKLAHGAMSLLSKGFGLIMGHPVVAAIAAIVAIFVVLWNKCDGFRQFWLDLWEVLKEKVSSFIEWFKTVPGAVIGWFTQKWDSIKNWWTDLWNYVKNTASSIWNSITSKVQEFRDAIINKFSEMFEGVNMVFEGVKTVMFGAWEAIKNFVMGIVLLICDLIIGDFESLKEDFFKLWDNITHGLKMVWDGIWTTLAGWLTMIIGFWSEIWGDIWAKLCEIWDNIWTYLCDMFKRIGEQISESWKSFKETISNKLSEIKNWVIDTFNSIVEWLKELPGKMVARAQAMWDAFISKCRAMKNAVVDSVKYCLNAAIDWIKDLPRQAVTWGKHMIEGFMNGLSAAKDALVSKVKGIASNIRDFLGFTVPKKGPLHVYMEWMPHMIQGMTKSLLDEQPRLVQAAMNVAKSLDDTLSPQLASATNFGDLDLGVFDADIKKHLFTDTTIHDEDDDDDSPLIQLNVNIAGEKVEEQIVPITDKSLGKKIRRRNK